MIKKITEHASCSNKATNLHELLTCLTSTIVCRTAFGRRYEEEGIEKSMFHGLFREALELIVSFFYEDYFPLFGGIVDKYFTGMTGRLEKMFKVLDGFFQGIIDEHLDPERRKKLPADHEEDVIDALLQLKNDPSFSMDLTPDHIKPLIMVLLFLFSSLSILVSISNTCYYYFCLLFSFPLFING